MNFTSNQNTSDTAISDIYEKEINPEEHYIQWQINNPINPETHKIINISLNTLKSMLKATNNMALYYIDNDANYLEVVLSSDDFYKLYQAIKANNWQQDIFPDYQEKCAAGLDSPFIDFLLIYYNKIDAIAEYIKTQPYPGTDELTVEQITEQLRTYFNDEFIYIDQPDLKRLSLALYTRLKIIDNVTYQLRDMTPLEGQTQESMLTVLFGPLLSADYLKKLIDNYDSESNEVKLSIGDDIKLPIEQWLLQHIPLAQSALEEIYHILGTKYRNNSFLVFTENEQKEMIEQKYKIQNSILSPEFECSRYMLCYVAQLLTFHGENFSPIMLNLLRQSLDNRRMFLVNQERNIIYTPGAYQPIELQDGSFVERPTTAISLVLMSQFFSNHLLNTAQNSEESRHDEEDTSYQNATNTSMTIGSTRSILAISRLNTSPISTEDGSQSEYGGPPSSRQRLNY